MAEEPETAADRAFIDDDNHSQGDAQIEMLDDSLLASLYVPGKCVNVIGYDPETDEDIICGDACNPNEQICHFCRTEAHNMH